MKSLKILNDDIQLICNIRNRGKNDNFTYTAFHICNNLFIFFIYNCKIVIKKVKHMNVTQSHCVTFKLHRKEDNKNE